MHCSVNYYQIKKIPRVMYSKESSFCHPVCQVGGKDKEATKTRIGNTP